MKKKLLLLLTLPLLASCSGSYEYTPKYEYPGEDEIPVEPEIKEEDMTVNFYKDNTEDTPLYSMRWYMLEPLGECPTEAVLSDADAPDPLYPTFLGYSEFSSSIDEDHIWDFAKDYKQSNILNLYGIWVSK